MFRKIMPVATTRLTALQSTCYKINNFTLENDFFFFSFDFKIKLFTRVFDELVVNEWDSWFEWLNSHYSQCSGGDCSSFVLFAERKIAVWVVSMLVIQSNLS